jgi:hypothetical protein
MDKIPTPETVPQNITEAYEELTPQAFAAWIRLASAKPEQIKNRELAAKLLNYSVSQVTIIARELTALKYVMKYRTNPINRETGWLVIKKPTASAANGFVVLNAVLANLYSEKEPIGLSMKKRATQKEYKKRLYSTPKSPTNYGSSCVLTYDKPKKRPMSNDELLEYENPLPPLADAVLDARKNPGRCTNDKPKFKPMDVIGQPPKDMSKNGKASDGGGEQTPNSFAVISRNLSRCGENLDHGILLNTLNLELYQKKYKEKKDKEKIIRDLKRVSRRDTSYVSGKKMPKGQPDWSKLEQDLRNNPRITFSPSEKQRRQYVEIFNRSNRSLERQELLKKFGSEFGRIYSRYRRMLQKQSGVQPTYAIFDREARYCAPIAELCVRKGITPRQLLSYWHNHIGDFSDANMNIPPLSFLSSPANVDTVACSDLKELEPNEQAKRMSPGANSFSDMKLYDGRVRQTLQKAGYNTIKYSDRDLMSIQFSARAIAQGIDMFVDDELRPMAEHLAKTLYKGLELKF